MNEPRETLTFGPSPDGATHWGLHRLAATGLKGEAEKYKNPDGIVVNRWPLSELSVDEVRRRWGQGRFQVQWFALDGATHQNKGKGFVFELAADEVATEAPGPTDPVSQILAIQDRARATADRDLERILTLAQGFAQLQAGPGVAARAAAAPLDSEDAAELRRLRTENADLRARQMMREEAERVTAPLRAEIAERDRRIARLERESEREDAGPFEPGAPIGDTLVTAVLNKIASNPEAVLSVIGPLAAAFAPKAPAAAPTPPPAPAVAPPAALQPEPVQAPKRPTVVRFPTTAPVAAAPAVVEPSEVAEPSPYGKPTPIEPVPNVSRETPVQESASKPERIVELDPTAESASAE
jgi:hypothetical protein